MHIPTKQRILRVLRNLHLLSAAEQVNLAKNLWQHYLDNRKVALANPDFAFPPLRLMLDAYGSLSYQSYMDWGVTIAKIISEHLNPLLPPDKKPTILDWGCGPGRVIRFLGQELGRPADIWGCDYNRQSIDWCRANIPHCRFKLNGLEPPLPFGDNFFDALYCISVYTHLPEELGRRWFVETVRVVKPGGYILLTVAGDPFQDLMLADELDDYATHGCIERSGGMKGSRLFFTMHSPTYLKREFFAGYEVVLHTLFVGGQDVWVVRKGEGDVAGVAEWWWGGMN